ncbi:UPF0179 family protein [Picrophilus oshimae]|uniref:UPF0179 protein SAMN02745355_0122 n=1 Tax=Picrophilus torridus (strain ATCC 700027 / DSM 9790 / JCM 10055 / NBRC 100828 / KAW 2/3) TaxID=1122961 RepID=A0A8G2L7F0_PICTO|nr:UPF0179 family protein [Picrophilus oshimae]SMD30254.1 hypothetical protein SAMN02745355_0122 [Picrophilus oshimae DSM 9789]
MSKITLIGTDLAKAGMEFTFVGPLSGKCDECSLKNVCFNLEKGRHYRILNVRENINPCFIYNKNKVSTIEVEEATSTFNVQYSRRIMEGSSIELKSMECDYLTCPNIETCNLIHIKEPRKIVIKKILGRIECPKGYDMRKIES